MALYYIFLLALVQGITEFLPISSSGHLILLHSLAGQESDTWETSLLLDVAVHVGTLFSVLVYFRNDVWAMLCGFKDCLCGKNKSTNGRLTFFILISSLPVIAAGFAIHEFQPAFLRTVEIIGWTSVLFGVLLWLADTKFPTGKSVADMTLKDAVLIGLSQALALIPGTSRSGITMTAARFLGFSRIEAARYSLLLAMVAISGAGTIGAIDLVDAGDAAFSYDVLIAVALSFISGLIAIHLMMKWLSKASFTPFVIYRILLGLVLLGGAYSGMFS